MTRLSKQRQFEVLRAALGMVEERGSVQLDELSSAVGLPPGDLKALLDAVLYLEFHTPAATGFVGETGAFLFTETGHVLLTAQHWLRDLASEPPAPDAALRLLISGITMQAISPTPTPDLDRAVQKLRDVVSAQVVVPVDVPEFVDIAQRALRDGRSLRVRYLSEQADEPSDRELLPYRVFARWGHWYCFARPVDQTEPRYFRVDRMLAAEVGDTPFDPPDDVAIPEWFDLDHVARTVRVRMPSSSIDSLPSPHRLGDPTPLGDGRVEVDITVHGDHRLDHLLVCLPADADVLEPPEYGERRRDHARRLLGAYAE